MRRSRRRTDASTVARALVLSLAASGCGKSGLATDSARSAGGAAGASERAQTVGTGAAMEESRKTACPKTGHWIDCQVHERLIRSGLAPHDTTRDALPSLGPSPLVYRLGKGGLAVYLFADSATRARATRTLDTVKYVRVERGPTVLSQATVIENDNLLGLLFSKNEQQIERVSDALTAGPPQP